MSFTAEEALEFSPKRASDKVGSVHCLSWPVVDKRWISLDIEEKYKAALNMRVLVLKELDSKRKAGEIGSGLQAKVVITIPDQNSLKYFKTFNDFASFCIVSQIEFKEGPQDIKILPAEGIKCARCWNWRTDVGLSFAHPLICARCIQVVEQCS